MNDPIRLSVTDGHLHVAGDFDEATWTQHFRSLVVWSPPFECPPAQQVQGFIAELIAENERQSVERVNAEAAMAQCESHPGEDAFTCWGCAARSYAELHDAQFDDPLLRRIRTVRATVPAGGPTDRVLAQCHDEIAQSRTAQVPEAREGEG
jgi:hypothetical protein